MLPDGVYLRLRFDDYIAQRHRLGSTDKGKLWLHGEGWWWASPHNPFLPPRKTTPELLFGEAAHAAVLEGLHAYETRFCVQPAKQAYGDELLVTEPEIKQALREAGVHLGSTSGWKKADWCDAAELHLPDRPVWDAILAEFERRHHDRKPIPAEDDFAIRALRALGERDPEMRELLSVGADFPILTEVSVLYTEADGIQHRARFDKLLPVATGDMKTVGTWSGRPLAETLDDHIKRMAYDVQLADYHVARQHMTRMLLDGEHNLHGGTEEERTFIMAMADWNARGNRWGWFWLFYQKPDPAGRAPVLFPIRHAWQGGYHHAGYRKRQHGLATYKRCMAEFGPDAPWGRVEPTHYVEEGAEHRLALTPWGAAPGVPAPDEETHFARFATGE